LQTGQGLWRPVLYTLPLHQRLPVCASFIPAMARIVRGQNRMVYQVLGTVPSDRDSGVPKSAAPRGWTTCRDRSWIQRKIGGLRCLTSWTVGGAVWGRMGQTGDCRRSEDRGQAPLGTVPFSSAQKGTVPLPRRRQSPPSPVPVLLPPDRARAGRLWRRHRRGWSPHDGRSRRGPASRGRLDVTRGQSPFRYGDSPPS
jgi:hypothetical protein